MTDYEAILEFKKMIDKVDKITYPGHEYYHNVDLLKMMITTQLCFMPNPSYSMIRNFCINESDPFMKADALPSLEQLSEPGAIQKYWGFIDEELKND